MTTEQLADKAAVLFEDSDCAGIIEWLPDDTLTQHNSAALYAWRARAHLLLSEFQQAALYSDLSFSANGTKDFALLVNGMVCLKTDKFGNAMDSFGEAIRLNPDHALSFFSRGSAWIEKREWSKAIDDFTEAIRINPNDAMAYLNRGFVWSNQGECDKAIDDYTQVIRLNPDDAVAYNNRGNDWKQKEKWDKAIQDFTEAIRLDPGVASTYSNRADAWQSKREWGKAFKDFAEAIRLDPDDASAYSNRGNTWRIKGEPDKAIADYTEAIRIKPNYASAYSNRGNVWSSKGEQEKAIADYEEVIRLDPDFSVIYYNLYLTLFNDNQISLSLLYLNRAVYLGFSSIHLLQEYHRNFFGPFMLQRIMDGISKQDKFWSLLETYSENEVYGKNWQSVIRILDGDYAGKEPEALQKTKACIHYFMGDCIGSYQIFDRDIKGNDSYSLSLHDWYYYIKSAQSFFEPCEASLSLALQQAASADSSYAEDMYYAGLLQMLTGDAAAAEVYFSRSAATGFTPALYQLAALYDEPLYDAEKRSHTLQQIDTLEKSNPFGRYLLNGIQPVSVSTGEDVLTASYELCRDFALYDENIETIQLVRTLMHNGHPYGQYEFWQMIEFEDKEFFRSKAEHYELLSFEQLLLSAFRRYCENNGESFFRLMISRNDNASTADHGIDADLEKYSNLTYETALAKKISNMKQIGVIARWFLVLAKLYYLQNKISLTDAICLHMYAQDIAIRTSDHSIASEINLEVQVWVCNILTLSSPLLTKLLFESLKFIRDGFVLKKPEEDNIREYEKFRQDYYLHLSFWKNSFASEFIGDKKTF